MLFSVHVFFCYFHHRLFYVPRFVLASFPAADFGVLLQKDVKPSR